MPIEAPKLDALTYAEIMAEARRRIPRYTPEWTDLNESDPGIALVELFAWLTEMMLFQMNRVPERNYVKFLNLLDIAPQPAQPAAADLSFLPDPAGGDVPRLLPAGTGVLSQVSTANGAPIIFETERDLEMIRVPLTAVQVASGGRFTLMTEANAARLGFYYPFGRLAQTGDALYLGFGTLEAGGVGETGAEESAAEGGEILEEPFPRAMSLGVFVPAELDNAPETTELELLWEAAESTGAWRRLRVLEDRSRAFTRTGTVLLEGPRTASRTRIGVVEEPLFWLRCRVAGGPALAPDGAVSSPLIDTVAPNTARSLSLVTVRDEELGVSTGLANQIFRLEFSPIYRGSLDLVTELAAPANPGDLALPATAPAAAVTESWYPVDDLFAAGPGERVYEIDRSSGLVRFGDGLHGRIPPADSRVVALVYRYGGGAAANVDAGLIDQPLGDLGDVAVTNWQRAEGGRDEESVDEVKRRAPLALRNRNRAVTAEDYAALATETGGVAQASALALFDPEFPGVRVPGAVTVVVVPETDAVPPRPSSLLLDEVQRRLEPLRMITTELFVTGPTFVDLAIDTVVLVDPAADPRDVEDRVGEALAELLGPEEQRIGQGLFPGQIYRAVLGVSGVRDVARLRLTVGGEPHPSMEKPIVVPPDGYLALVETLVEVRDARSLFGDVFGEGGEPR